MLKLVAGMARLQIFVGPFRIWRRNRNLRSVRTYLASRHHIVQQVRHCKTNIVTAEIRRRLRKSILIRRTPQVCHFVTVLSTTVSHGQKYFVGFVK